MAARDRAISYERFTDRARKVIDLANQEAQRWNHEYIGTEHVLIGLVKEGAGVAANVLKNLDVDLKKLRREVEKFVHSGAEMVTMGKLPLTPRVKKALELAAKEAKKLGHNYIGTEHILLGLLQEQDGIAAQVLVRLGLTLKEIRREVLAILGHAMPDESSGDVKEHRHERVVAFRVLDAAANRASEGLRVVEDYVRFVLDDRHLTELAKKIRHTLSATFIVLPIAERLESRDTAGDVGTDVKTAREKRRETLNDVLHANFHRLFEALRSLEEFSKLPCPALATEFERLRYQAYDLHRAIGITTTSIERLNKTRLYVLVDAKESPQPFERLIDTLITAGVHTIQLRDKGLTDRELLKRARMIRTKTRGTDTLFIMNDRPDLARVAHADGVHVGQDELSVKDARSIIGPQALVGVSAHSIEQARQAVLDGANYIGVGPVFASETKEFDHLPGLELVRAVAAEIKLPAFAIGGITLENLDQVLAAGATRVAVSAAIAAADEPAAACEQFLRRMP
jgi:thiamine-phosphate pyrophosphorylase